MDCRELNEFAAGLLLHKHPTEAEIRRGISALYYGLFHQLTGAGAALFAAGGASLQARAARAFNHREMWAVCRDISQTNPHTLARRFGPALTYPDPRLVRIADTFIALQQARETADYDLSVQLSPTIGVDLLRMANHASADFDSMPDIGQKTAFLAALLLADRWTRRG